MALTKEQSLALAQQELPNAQAALDAWKKANPPKKTLTSGGEGNYVNSYTTTQQHQLKDLQEVVGQLNGTIQVGGVASSGNGTFMDNLSNAVTQGTADLTNPNFTSGLLKLGAAAAATAGAAVGGTALMSGAGATGAGGAGAAGAGGAGAAGAGGAGAAGAAIAPAAAGAAAGAGVGLSEGLVGASILGNIYTADQASNAISDAAATQGAATQTATELQAQGQADALAFNKEQWDKIQSDQAPWLAAGTQALSEYQNLPAFAAPDKFTGNRMVNYTGPQEMAAPNATGAYQGGTTLAAPNQMEKYTGQVQFDPNSVATDPGFKFRTDQAQKALERSQVGRRLGGRAAQEVTQLSQDMASQEYGAAYNRGTTTNQLINQNNLTPYTVNRDTSNQNLQNTMAVTGYNDQTGMNKYLTNRDTSNQNLQNTMAVNQLNTANNLNTFNANQAVDTSNYTRALGEYQMGYNQTWDQYMNQQNKLAQIAGLGYNATQNTAQTGAQIAANQGNIAMGGANAIAGTQMAGANAQGQATIANAANQTQTWGNIGNLGMAAYLA